MLVTFFGVFSVSVSVAFFVRRFWSPTWPQLGPLLEPCWAFFETFLGALLLSSFKMLLETIFDRFLIDFRPPGTSKNIKKPMVF